MVSKTILAAVAGLSTASAYHQGFNYAATDDFASKFALAKNLVGTDGGFTSARLYTSLATNGVDATPAFSAAINTNTSLLLGLWASSGQTTITNEIAAIKSAVSQYGDSLAKLVVGISVGSEDLYRISPTGILNKEYAGAEPSDLVNYIGQVRSALAGTALSNAPIGHVDTWTSWVNGSNSAVTAACDFVGVDAYPYFQSTQANGIDNAYDLFYSAYDQTIAAANGKPVWVTETGWPQSGANLGSAVANTANAQTYWQTVGCKLRTQTNLWYYTLQDAGAPLPNFGVTTGSTTPLYNLTCPAVSSSSTSSSSSSSAASSSSGTATAGTNTVVNAGGNPSNVQNSMVSVTASANPTQLGGTVVNQSVAPFANGTNPNGGSPASGSTGTGSGSGTSASNTSGSRATATGAASMVKPAGLLFSFVFGALVAL